MNQIANIFFEIGLRNRVVGESFATHVADFVHEKKYCLFSSSSTQSFVGSEAPSGSNSFSLSRKS